VLYGHLPGFRLSALGRAQSVAVGELLRPEKIRRIAHSPLERAKETAEIIAAQLAPAPELEVEPKLTEAEFSRYLQGVPYWQVPIRRPLWLVHKARRGILPGDESIETMGKRILDVVRRLSVDHPGETAAIVSHADPLNAAWIVLDGRPQNEREMHRKEVGKAGMLRLEIEGETPTSWEYVPPPRIDRSETAAA
jgi:broad specificity phosphatase PhoE